MVNAKAIIAYIVIIAVVVAAWGLSTGFKLPYIGPSSSTTTTTTTTSSSTTTITTTSTTTINYGTTCSSLFAYTASANTTMIQGCRWSGGPLGLWIAAGPASSSHVKIIGASDNVIYINETSGYSCATFFRNFTAPAQNYTITLTTSNTVNTSSTCGYAFAKLNTTLSPPHIIYNYVFNGNFSSGTYTGWSTVGNGFGIAPLNITFALTSNTAHSCYIGYIGGGWANYNTTFVATTFNCGLSNAPGNLTSSLFYAKKPFLNFRIISQQDNLLYVEILYNGTPYIIAHYNTYNSSFHLPGKNCTASNKNNTINNNCATGSYVFRNASIPLITVLNKPIQIRVVADTLNRLTFIAVEGFSLASSPKQDKGVLYGSYNFT